MNLETFFNKFDQFADAPDAVGQMRKVVLDLAVRGKLEPQDPNDESAEEIVGRVKAGRPEDIEAPVDEAEMPWSLPSYWQWVHLGTIANISHGYAFSSESFTSEPTPYVLTTPGNFYETGGFRDRGANTKYFDGDVPPAFILNPRDLIIPMTEQAAGLLGSPAFIPDDGKTYLHNQRLGKLEFYSAELMPEFVFWFFNSNLFRGELARTCTGMKVRHTSPKRILKVPIPLPPLAEQKRIVAKVDELMALCDRLEAQQQERTTRHNALTRASLARFADAPTLANLPFLFHPSYAIPPADLRKSILTLAVQGKLVPQDPNDGNARDAIDRAIKKRQQTIQSKNLRRKALDESEELISEDELPASWCVERFANLVDPENTISYGVLVPGSDVASGIPFVRVQDLSINSPAKLPNKTIASEIEKPYARTRLRGGEILLCVVGATIGRLGVAPASWAGANIARAVARIAPIAEVNRYYLLLVLRSPLIQSYFATTTRTLAQPTLNVGAIEQTPIPLPPLAEQRRIVAKVEQLMALVDALETQLAASRATAANLLSALVAELTTV